MTTEIATPVPATDSASRRAALMPIVRDVALPMSTYYALHAYGAGDFAALLGGTLVAAAVMAVTAIRARRVDAIAGFVMAGYAFGLVTSLLTGDARMMIVKDSAGTALIGIAFAMSAALGKPLLYQAIHKTMLASNPSKAAAFAQRYESVPAMRRTLRILAAVWGAALLLEAGVRAVLAYQLPVSTMVWLSPLLLLGVIAPLSAAGMYLAYRFRSKATANATAGQVLA